MNGIKMSDCKFYVNEEAKTVVCVIPDAKEMLDDFVSENFRFSDFDMHFMINDYDMLKMPKSFIGKAVCSADDEWDEELGRMIAFSRAKDKFYKSFFKRANNFINAVDRRLGDMIETFNDLGAKVSDKKEKLEHMIEEKMQK